MKHEDILLAFEQMNEVPLDIPFRRFRRIPTCINWIPTRFLDRRHSPILPFNLFEVGFKRSSLTVPLGCHYTSHGQSQYVAL
jgi:hypothetical protein